MRRINAIRVYSLGFFSCLQFFSQRKLFIFFNQIMNIKKNIFFFIIFGLGLQTFTDTLFADSNLSIPSFYTPPEKTFTKFRKNNPPYPQTSKNAPGNKSINTEIILPSSSNNDTQSLPKMQSYQPNTLSDPDWWVWPYGKDNPIFQGGPLFFLSSRIGQLYVPGAVVSLYSPFYDLTSSMMSFDRALALKGLTTEYIAHVSWRLGCDQGYLGAKELAENNYPHLRNYFWGTPTERVYPHRIPSLSSNLDQTITPMALLYFGLGQVIGQRIFKPFIEKKLLKLSFFQKQMSPSASMILVDHYGWPIVGSLSQRAEAVAHLSGILMGTYLGWSNNDVGWQVFNWHKFSLEPYSEYMPYFGIDGFGTFDKGWGIIGFTVGGLYGHNLGASLGEISLNRMGLTQNHVNRFKRWTAQGLKNISAIGGNLALGLALTTYFPKIASLLFDQRFSSPINDPLAEKDFIKLTSEEKQRFVQKFVVESLDQNFIQMAVMMQKSLNDSLSMVQNNPRSLGSPIAPSNGNDLPGDFNDQDLENRIKNDWLETSRNHKKSLELLIQFMVQHILHFSDGIIKSVSNINSNEELKNFLIKELKVLMPSELYLDRDKAIEQIVDSPQLKKERIVPLLVFLFPLYYKFRFVQIMQEFVNNYNLNENSYIANLYFKRDLVILQLVNIMVQSPEKGAQLKEKFIQLSKTLVQSNLQYYEANPHLLEKYEKGLDDLNMELNTEAPLNL